MNPLNKSLSNNSIKKNNSIFNLKHTSFAILGFGILLMIIGATMISLSLKSATQCNTTIPMNCDEPYVDISRKYNSCQDDASKNAFKYNNLASSYETLKDQLANMNGFKCGLLKVRFDSFKKDCCKDYYLKECEGAQDKKVTCQISTYGNFSSQCL